MIGSYLLVHRYDEVNNYMEEALADDDHAVILIHLMKLIVL